MESTSGEVPSTSPLQTNLSSGQCSSSSSILTSVSVPASEIHLGTELLSKNKLRKLRRYEQSLLHRNVKRAKERETRKLSGRSNGRGNDEKLEQIKKLKAALETGCTVVIDCQFQNQMSKKELTRFAHQLRRVYSSNRSVSSPLHLYLASLSKDSELFSVCCKQNDGFANYIWDITEKSVLEVFEPSKVIYLTPDAPNVLSLEKGFEEDKVYVIGGYVDETTTKNQTHKFARRTDIPNFRLPIDEFFKPGEKGTFKKVLTVNQVVDIILEWHCTHDWVASIKKGLPERTGFIPREQTSTE